MESRIDQLLLEAVTSGASDVHLKVGSSPVVRIDGELQKLNGYEPLTPSDTEALAEELFTERAAADFESTGGADFAYGKHAMGRFRVTAFRQRGSVSLVLRRVMPGSKTFADLGLPSTVEKLAQEPYGLLLVTGPSGSGKTTTQASIIDWINSNRGVSILTIEDPIEVLHPDKRSVVAQREVGVDTPDVAGAVRRAMRHDTDVILISEIDNLETAMAAIDAAETGHLVISSMRTTDPADTVSRIVSMFPESNQPVVRGQLAAQLLAIISQRLLETKDMQKVLACEILTNNERTQEWILGGSDTSSLIEIMKESAYFGMRTFDQSLLKLVVDNVVDLPVVLPHTRNTHELKAKAMEAAVEI